MPIKRKIRGLRDKIPKGYILGRTDNGTGPVQLIKISDVAGRGGGGGSGFTAATTTQQLQGTAVDVGSTPDSVAALWEKGADVASAATVSLGEGGFFHITGTTTITDIDFATDKSGRRAWLVFDGALTLTHNATSLILPGGADIVTAAGDTCLVASEDGSNNVRVLCYIRASGAAINQVYDIGAFISGRPSSNEIVWKFTAVRPFTLPVSLTNSQFTIGTNPTATMTWTLKKNGSSIGTVAFDTSGVPTVTFASGISFAIGDILSITAPGSTDSTGADTFFGFVTVPNFLLVSSNATLLAYASLRF